MRSDFNPTPRIVRRRRNSKADGFTLIELLVVIGIIAVLIALIMPSLSRAKELAKQIQCANNLRHIGMAVLMYCDNSKGLYPGCGESGSQAWDWIYWLQFGSPYTKLDDSALAPYVGIPVDPNIFRCPTDNWQDHTLAATNGNYHGGNIYYYSYSGNCYFFNGGSRGTNGMKITDVHNASDKALIIDEDYRTINDPYWCPVIGFNSDILSDRHEIRKDLSDFNARGNILFADGHAAFESRNYLDDANHIYPAN